MEILAKGFRKKEEANDPSCYKRVVHKASFSDGGLVWQSEWAGISILYGHDKGLRLYTSEVNHTIVQRLFGRKRHIFQQDNARLIQDTRKHKLRSMSCFRVRSKSISPKNI
ncbi:hypothetical protein AVEN_208349-1 [Araneus ventricosus]|uniref:Uncharacterized protein n=1 Tax=Araneus ventricosus TaxID=182803 RepID=A0A4Y2FD88_ARAVE|nr:hypothetical protein AVEN_208349-1 [Araneus ventricosus]